MTDDSTPETGALTQEFSDEEIMAALNEQREANAAAAAAAQAAGPKQVSLQDLYFQMTALVKTEANLPRRGKLSEGQAVKILELALGWALQTRNTGGNGSLLNDIPTQEIGGEFEGGETPAPDEAIGFDADEEAAA